MDRALHRSNLILAAGLDGVGLVLIALVIESLRSRSGLGGVLHSPIWLVQQWDLFLALLVGYWSLGWLFGSYTLLKLRQITWQKVALRVGSTSFGCVIVGVLLGWTLKLPPDVTLLHRGSLIPLFGVLTIWSASVKLLIRLRRSIPNQKQWLILALSEEKNQIEKDWMLSNKLSSTPTILTIEPENLQKTDHLGEALALSPGIANLEGLEKLVESGLAKGQTLQTLVELAELELQRIPPRWVGHQWLLFTSQINCQRNSIQDQIKRFADVVISLITLIISVPFLLIIGLAIKLQDGGPIFYTQIRSGLYGLPFTVLKIRTMVKDAESGTAQWTEWQDSRITPLGAWLRKTRIDELPQLINVLKGEMSLIGPRPERPELESKLEEKIPSYRLRHLIRPGLSGWAQVCMPYTSSVEGSELKLSYDLFYLRNASTWLDILIMIKTIKIIFKAAGR